ncbi:HesB/IscA family protein [Asticcacaulis taihuensis]|jgi:iron-sulfur cluster assembly accessory protein|uniref:Iron-sulfur cluster assembly accessory protein n=1 Tax=Asticcacaulis taihuensis TaxID=260084 RepID=A0A1G4Q545_9CAUL|nr:iron-sulfur cluster assembly accessory protein [Asticcacaulis taihuensis]SCW39279.1 Iron-sulfur cluster assembly accessory protein [Asticcacaulis taihuensis]
MARGADFAGECAHIAAMSHNITLTASAAKHLNALSNEAGHPVMLRVMVEGGGCSGFQYVLDLTDTANPDESRIEYEGATALVDEVSAPLMAGSMIDYVEELVGSQFKILNPLAVASCGCGTSFSL